MDIKLRSQSYSGSRFALKKLILSLSRQLTLVHQNCYHLSFMSSLLPVKHKLRGILFRVLRSSTAPSITLSITYTTLALPTCLLRHAPWQTVRLGAYLTSGYAEVVAVLLARQTTLSCGEAVYDGDHSHRLRGPSPCPD